MADKEDYVDLGLACVDVCRVLDRGMNGRRADDLSRPVLEAIEQLTTLVDPAMHTSADPLTELSIVGPWPRSRGRSLSGVDGTLSPDSSTRGTIKRRSPPGDWTSAGPFMSSTCVPSLLYDHR